MTELKTDIAIVGGGAAGLCAAISALQTQGNLTVTVFERLSKSGKKILATGNGRCNLSHENITPKNYHGSVDTTSLLKRLPSVVPFFSSLGLITYTDNEGRIYPFSNSAATVLDILKRRCEELGAKIVTDAGVNEIVPIKSGFLLKAETYSVNARSIILATGGCAQSALGSDGSGFRIAEKLGVKICPPTASLCPILVKKSQLQGLSGVRVKACASLLRDGSVLKSESGEVQFSDSYISGICVFNLSRIANIGDEIRLDLMENYSTESVKEIVLDAASKRKNPPVETLLCGVFNKKLAVNLVKRITKKPLSALAGELTKQEIYALCDIIKSFPFTVTGSSDFSAAQVSAGGVLGSEIFEDFMSKRFQGLYFAGEVLDADGDCGGYNLHFAWASGLISGQAAALSLRSQND